MKLALIQHRASSDDEANVQRALIAVRDAAASGAQVIAFPELAFTRFFPQHRRGERDRFLHSHEIPGPLVRKFQDLAAELGVVIVLNLFERDGNRTFDSSPVIDSDGRLLGVTRMMHITHYEGFWEQDYYDPGDTGAPVFETAFGRIGVAICYDRHYPEYMRALALAGAELVIIPQAGATGEWPAGLFEAEMRVASFHNGYFTALANRVGAEDVLTFGGGSFVSDPSGQLIARAPENKEAVLFADLDLSACAKSAARTLFMEHRRPEEYEGGAVRRP